MTAKEALEVTRTWKELVQAGYPCFVEFTPESATIVKHGAMEIGIQRVPFLLNHVLPIPGYVQVALFEAPTL